MARLDPNQAAAAATNQPIPGADPLGQPMVDMQNPVPAAGEGPSQAEIDAAINMGMNPNNMSSDEWDFVRVFNQGGLASIEPDGDPENPLIPGEGAPPQGVQVPPTIPTEPAADAPPPATGEGRVGPAASPEGGATDPTPDPGTAPSPVTTPEVVETPGRPMFQIPSTLPPAPPEPSNEVPPPQLAPNLVQLADGSVVTLETYQALLAAQQQQQPFAQQQPVQAPPVVQPSTQGYVPNAWSPTPGEYVDERAQLEIEALRLGLQQTQAQTAAALEAAQANTRQSIEVAVEETKAGYADARALSPEQVDGLLDNAVRLGLVGVYSQQFPGDPRRAVAAAMENVYWNTPEYQQLEVQRRLEEERAANAELERKKAFAGQTTGSPGSVPRVATQAAPGDRAAQNQGIVAMIEADEAFQAQRAQRG